MTIVVNKSGNNDIDALLWGWKWDTTASALITWELPFGTAEYIDSDADPVQTGYLPGGIVGFHNFDGAQQNAVGLILANVAGFAHLFFSQIFSPPDPLANTATTFRYAEATSINYTNDSTVAGHTGTHAITTAEANPPELPFNGTAP